MTSLVGFWGNSIQDSKQKKENWAAADRRTARAKSCALTARGSISEAMKGLVCSAEAGSAKCQKQWTRTLIPRSSGQGAHPSGAEGAQAARTTYSLEWRQVQDSSWCIEGRSKTGTASPPSCQVSAHECCRPCRQASRTPGYCHFFCWRGTEEVAVPGARYSHSCFGHRRVPRRLSIPPQYTAHVLEETKGPQCKNI